MKRGYKRTLSSSGRGVTEPLCPFYYQSLPTEGENVLAISVTKNVWLMQELHAYHTLPYLPTLILQMLEVRRGFVRYITGMLHSGDL